MTAREAFWIALEALRGHKLRSFLTLLGVVVATTTLIVVMSVVNGMNLYIAEHIANLGTNTFVLHQFQWAQGFDSFLAARRRNKPIRVEDYEFLRDNLQGYQHIGAMANLSPNPPARPPDRRGHRERDDCQLCRVVNMFFTAEVPLVAVVILVDGHSLEIVGTLAKFKSFLGDDQNDKAIFIPYHSFQKTYPEAKDNFICVLVEPGRMDQAKDEVTELLRRRRRVKPADPDNFGISSAESLIGQFRQLIGTVGLVMVVISSIGLLVGGIGVMNIMLVSVTEQTREIGLRKAIGARRRDIIWQFLLEAMTLTASGGLIGILVGWLLSVAIRTFVPSLPSTVPLWSVVAGFSVATSVGLFFGLWPALKAARLDPIAALRYE